MLIQLSVLAQQGQIRPIDYQFARFIQSLHDDPLLTLCSALVSYELGKGNVCLPIASSAPEKLFDLPPAQSDTLLKNIKTPNWQQYLKNLPPVGIGKNAGTPLIFDQGNLYLNRYWHYEQRVTDVINTPVVLPLEIKTTREILDRLFARDYNRLLSSLQEMNADEPAMRQCLTDALDIVAPDDIDWGSVLTTCTTAEQPADLQSLEQQIPAEKCLNWQKVAASVASSQPFTVISGGPGTGKTTTVTRLLALLTELGLKENRSPDIFLVAPTGKAAARLTESIGNARDELACSDEVKQVIPSQASTIHRLLGVLPGKPAFRHNKDNPLHLDILVVDEASMVDLPLMAHLLDALPDKARLILLGDRDQLASVEAGSVLGDICGFAKQNYSPAQADKLQQLTGYSLAPYSNKKGAPVRDSLCLLRKSYRFDTNSGIGHLARAVNEGHTFACKHHAIRQYQDVDIHDINSTTYQSLLKLAVSGYGEYLKAIKNDAPEKDILSAFNNFRLLCALREGMFGVEGLNQAIYKALMQAKLLNTGGDKSNWYIGRPVMITRNDHGVGLYNGDIGITLQSDDNRLRVAFEMPNGEIRSFLPSRLPEHDTVFAMTVHKSQGSEFKHTVMVLPDKMNPVLTRELVYTGITRAKKRLDIFTREEILAKAISQKTQRASGLPQKIQLMASS